MSKYDEDQRSVPGEADATPRISLAAFAGTSGVAVSTAWRWTTEGAKVRGQRIRLDHVRRGNRIFLSPQGIDEFEQACTQAGLLDACVDDTPPRTDAQRQAELAEIEAACDEEGI